MEKLLWTLSISGNLELESTLSILRESLLFREERRKKGGREGEKQYLS